ncbi:MAG: sigma-70 family RNA polymerase sigma factor [Acidimicrobiales bacterium]
MASFEYFFQSNYRPVVQALGLAFGGVDGIEDQVQEAFARAYVRWSRVGAMERPAAWVYVIAACGLRRRLQRRGRQQAEGEREERVVVMEEQLVERVRVAGLLGVLPQRQRATVVLRYLVGLRVEEVAEALGCSPGTVKAAAHAGLRRLRIELEVTEDA